MSKLATIIAIVVVAFLCPTASVSAELLITAEFDGNANPMMTSQIVHAINEVAIEYTEVRGVRVTTEPMDAYAYAGGRDIVFNDGFVSDPDTYQRMVEEDVAAGFHPSLGRCSAVQYLAYHETAHVIHRSRNDNAISRAVTHRFGDGSALRGLVAGYSFYQIGIINPAEALAEAFAAVRCNGGNWAEQELYGMLTGPTDLEDE